jgi:hypothetical protein
VAHQIGARQKSLGKFQAMAYYFTKPFILLEANELRASCLCREGIQAVFDAKN